MAHFQRQEALQAVRYYTIRSCISSARLGSIQVYRRVKVVAKLRLAAGAECAKVAEIERIARQFLTGRRALLVRFRGGEGDGPASAEHLGESQPAVTPLPERF